MSKTLPTFLNRHLHTKNLDLLSAVNEVNEVFIAAGFPLELERLSTISWVNIPKSNGVHGMCWLMNNGEISIFVDERYKGEGMWRELRRLLAHECVHFVQYQSYSKFGDESYLDESLGEGGKALGYIKSHADFFHKVAAKVNEVEPELHIVPKHVGFDDSSELAQKSTVVVIDYQRDVLLVGKEHSELKSFETAFCLRSFDKDELLESVYEKFGSAATGIRVYETLSPSSESLPSLESSSRLLGSQLHLRGYSSLVSKIRNHGSTELVVDESVRSYKGKKIDVVVIDVADNNSEAVPVVFHSSSPIDVYQLIYEVVPFFGGKVLGISHYLTENLMAESSHKLTKGGCIRKNQKFTGHTIGFVNAVVDHASTELVKRVNEPEIFSRFVEGGFDSRVTGLDKKNHSYNLIKHVLQHVKSLPVIGDRIIASNVAERVSEIIKRQSPYLPTEIQERIVGGWEALSIKDFPELTHSLSNALECYIDGRTDLSEVFRELDEVYYYFGDHGYDSVDSFILDAVRSTGYSDELPKDFFDWEPDAEWVLERVEKANKLRVDGAVKNSWGDREVVEGLFDLETSLRFAPDKDDVADRFECLLSKSISAVKEVGNGGLSKQSDNPSQLGFGF